MARRLVSVALLAHLAAPLVAEAQLAGDDRCVADTARSSAPALLERARHVTGYETLGSSVLHYQAVDQTQDYYQSDRPYPPFHSLSDARELWLDPTSGVVRTSTVSTGVASGPGRPLTTLATERSLWIVRDTTLLPVAGLLEASYQTRPLDVYTVLHDWSVAPDVRVVGRCFFREYWRTVLARQGARGEERLYLDPKSGFPVKLDRREPHYLWGAQHVEYVWVTWYDVGPFPTPMSTVRLTDGIVHIQRSLGAIAPLPRDSAPPLAVPDTALRLAFELPIFLHPLPPDTVRVAPNIVLLRNRGYTEAVALVRDTIWMLEATQGEARARLDSAWIARLFPGPHPLRVVVTDLAWPHIAGVRYWVATGAPIISHATSRDFLERVVSRRFADAPDLLEQRRASRRLRFIGVDRATKFAGGDVVIAPIDGIGSEGALVVYFPKERFLWGSDFVQNTTAPSLYVSEVVAAARREGWQPLTVAAQHAPPLQWTVLDSLAARRP